MISATIQAFFDNDTNTVSYLVSDPASSESAIIDSVLDYDQASARLRLLRQTRLSPCGSRGAGLSDPRDPRSR